MCTLILFRRPTHRWPVIIGSNRDEMFDREWKFPGRHWIGKSNIVGGLDKFARGSWLGINDEGVFSSVLNRKNSLGPAHDKRSRGELVLKALDHLDAQSAAETLVHSNGKNYQPFNLIIADYKSAFWLRNIGESSVECHNVPYGYSMFTAEDMNSPLSPRVQFNLPRFKAANVPNPEVNNWKDWEQILAGNDSANQRSSPSTAICVPPTPGFGTVNSSLIAIPNNSSGKDQKPLWRFAPGPPNKKLFLTVPL